MSPPAPADRSDPAPSGWHRFTAASPTGAELAPGDVLYGDDIASERTIRLLGSLEARRVLDLGCGAGQAAVTFAHQGAKVLAVDADPEQVAATRRAAEQAGVSVELHEGDLAELAFLRKDTLDLVFSAYALAEVEDLDRVFRQVHRVLKPESPFVFSLPHPAFTMLDPTGDDPLRITRPYHSDEAKRWVRGGVEVVDHPRTTGQLFLSLSRANFRVDALLEPKAGSAGAGGRGPGWAPVMDWVPPTLIIRARKQGI